MHLKQLHQIRYTLLQVPYLEGLLLFLVVPQNVLDYVEPVRDCHGVLQLRSERLYDVPDLHPAPPLVMGRSNHLKLVFAHLVGQ